MGRIKPMENSRQKEEQTILLALAATQHPDSAGSCLSPGQMASLADMRLDTDEYEAALEHLDTCSSCYMKWLKLSLATGGKTGKSRIKKRVIYSFALAASLLIFLQFIPFINPFDRGPISGTPELSKLISKSYNSVFIQEITLNHDAFNSLPWKKTSQFYGFGDSDQYSPAFRAFGAGLWSGRERLAKEVSPMPEFLFPGWQDKTIKGKTWPGTSWAVCYWMGQWCFLVHSACLSGSDVPPAFWDEQGRILARLQENYAELAEKKQENARVVNNALSRVKDAVNKKQPRKVAFELGILMEHFPK
ncbi:MAG: hypothetical protein GY795_35720 [Desulfobacterales bacterium]|nr:hypothetical protein [Desulfobacterales bacterium]